MPSEPKLDSAWLPSIDRALASTAWLIRIPPELAARYREQQMALRRPHNRYVVFLFMLLFDLFWFSQLRSAPEIEPLSAWLRFGLFTPCAVLFVWLDAHGRLGRFYGPCLVGLGALAALIGGKLTMMTFTGSIHNLPQVRSIPLILLGAGLVARLTPRELIILAMISVPVFAISVTLSPSIPRVELSGMIAADLAVAATSIGFNLQFESRERRLFLTGMAERISRAELAARNRGLLREVQTDGLTGVANRRCFDDTLAESWAHAQQTGTAIGLIMFDIDHFKKFNDFYGHHDGDECLRMVATRGCRQIRTSDLFARYGGEEFAVILPGAELETVVTIAERIRASIEVKMLPHRGVGDTDILTVSVGAASMVPGPEDDARQLIEAADANLYLAKRGGRNRVCAGMEGQDSAAFFETKAAKEL